MMNFNEFTEKIKNEVEAKINKKCLINEIIKPHTKYSTLTPIQYSGVNISPCITLDGLYEDYQNGRTISDIIDFVCKMLKRKGNFDLDNILRKENIVLRVLSLDKHADYLNSVIYDDFVGDLVLEYRIHVHEPGNNTSTASIRMSEDILKHLDIDRKDLKSIAIENMQRLFPANVNSLYSMVKSQLSNMPDHVRNDIENDLTKFDEEADTMLVVTNSTGINGFAVCLYPNVLKEIANGRDMYIIPSSQHEALTLLCDNISKYACEQMLREANVTTVAPVDLLSDTLYYYNAATDTIEVA